MAENRYREDPKEMVELRPQATLHECNLYLTKPVMVSVINQIDSCADWQAYLLISGILCSNTDYLRRRRRRKRALHRY